MNRIDLIELEVDILKHKLRAAIAALDQLERMAGDPIPGPKTPLAVIQEALAIIRGK